MSCIYVFLLSVTWFELTETSVYPAVVWNPWNPLFACDEPSINIRIGDTVNFLCPSEEFNFFVPSSHVKLIYENLYFLGTNKAQYQACNATGMKKLLNCDGIQSNLYTIAFRDIQTSIDSLKFNKGETYYFIGTGFREKTNLGQTANGSCMHIDNEGENQLRLKIYVCKDDEIGCNICKTTGCYYKDCGNLICPKWESDGKIYKNSSQFCSEFMRRTCRNDLVGYNDHQTMNKEVTCPPEKINCSDWSASGNLYYDTKSYTCFSLEIRTCKNGFSGEDLNETRHINNTCPDILPSCTNWTTSDLSQKCIKLTTRQCEISFSGKFKESNYTEVPCTINLKPSIASTIATKINNTGTTMRLQVDHSTSMSATSLVTKINDPGTRMRVPVDHSTCMSAASLVTKINDPETTVTMPPPYLQNCNGQSSTVHGLAAAVVIAFVVGIMVGLLVFSCCNQHKYLLNIKVHPTEPIILHGNPELKFKVIDYDEKVDGGWRFACSADIENREKNSTSLCSISNFSEEIKDIMVGKNLHNCALVDGSICIVPDYNREDKIEVHKEVAHKLVVSTVSKDFVTGDYINKGYSPDTPDNVKVELTPVNEINV